MPHWIYGSMVEHYLLAMEGTALVGTTPVHPPKHETEQQACQQVGGSMALRSMLLPASAASVSALPGNNAFWCDGYRQERQQDGGKQDQTDTGDDVVHRCTGGGIARRGHVTENGGIKQELPVLVHDYGGSGYASHQEGHYADVWSHYPSQGHGGPFHGKQCYEPYWQYGHGHRAYVQRQSVPQYLHQFRHGEEHDVPVVGKELHLTQDGSDKQQCRQRKDV